MKKDKKCPKHPKYKGKRKPKYECVTCLSLYTLLKSKPRVLPMPTKKFKDKTKYTRKKKHKEKE
jgi:hypothetical protein